MAKKSFKISQILRKEESKETTYSQHLHSSTLPTPAIRSAQSLLVQPTDVHYLIKFLNLFHNHNQYWANI